MKRRTLLAAASPVPAALAGCVSVDIGGEPAAQVQLALRDGSTRASGVRRAVPLVDALLVQALPAGSQIDTTAIAYSRQNGVYYAYQLSSWSERPARQLPRLLVQRLEASGVAGAVGLLGDPLRADWLLTLDIDGLYHDVAQAPGVARLAFAAALFDRRTRTRVAQRAFRAAQPTPSADAVGAAQGLSAAVAHSFDELLPWLEQALAAAAAPGRRPGT